MAIGRLYFMRFAYFPALVLARFFRHSLCFFLAYFKPYINQRFRSLATL